MAAEKDRRLATRRQVAEAAGVSPAVVSAVLGGGSVGIRVSAATRMRVVEAASRLGYRPNPLAQGLKRQRSSLIGLSFFRSNGWFLAPMIQGMQLELAGRGCSLVVELHHDQQSEAAAVRRLQHRRIDGLIANAAQDAGGRANAALFEETRQLCIPLVEIFGKVIPAAANFNLDHADGAAQVVRHLLGLGCRRIALLTHSAWDKELGGLYFNAREHQAGYAAELRRAGLEPQVFTYPLPQESGDLAMMRQIYQGGRGALQQILAAPEPPDAVIGFDSSAAAGLLSACREAGIGPDRLRVAGTEHDAASLLGPNGIVAVDFNLEDLGRAVVRGLFTALEGRSPSSLAQAGYLRSPS